MTGFFEKYLDVDLSTGEKKEYHIPEEWYAKHLGGRGIATRIFLNELDGGINPLGPNNLLIWATGPFQGTGIAGAGRHGVFSKSPKTHTYNESYVGGYFGHELGNSGYDGIIIRGKSEKPVYITLLEGQVEIHDADRIWGSNTDDTEEWIKKNHGRLVRVASIGPAGERLIPFACIINDLNRANGRPGFGAVMGSKNLKAIGVKGDREKTLFDEKAMKKLRRTFAQRLIADSTMGDFGKLGTTGGLLALNELGILPTRNFQGGAFQFAKEISGEQMLDTILIERATCAGCPVRCKRVVETEFNGQKVEPKFGGPEYETLAAFGSLCENRNLNSIALANKKCNQYGLDTISTGNIIAFTMEATEKGLLKHDIHWGDDKAIVKTLDLIVEKKGIGELLSNGLDEVSKEIGGEDFAVHVKGLEVPMHEPRGKKGLAISYATSPRGATHLEAMHDTLLEKEDASPELGVTEAVNRLGWEGKVDLCKIYEDLYSFCNSIIICGFNSWDRATGDYYPFPDIRSLLHSITGLEIDAKDMMEIGERNYVIRKIIAANDGFEKGFDGLPKRLREPLKSGACKGESIPVDKLDEMIDKYYSLRGFDRRGPTDAKLAELGLEELAGKIRR